MKRVSVFIVLGCFILCCTIGCSNIDDKYLTISTTVTLAPGESATLTEENGKIEIDGIDKPKVPAVVGKAPLWMRDDLELAFTKLSKSAFRVSKDAFLSGSTFKGKEILIISATGDKPILLELPEYKDVSNILPQSIDKTARIALGDINSDQNPDAIICPKNGGCHYLLGPDFSSISKTGNIHSNPGIFSSSIFPITTPQGLVELCPKPDCFCFYNSDGKLVKCDQKNFLIALPNAYAAMTAFGLFFIDRQGDLRLFDRRQTGIDKPAPTGYSSKSESALPSFSCAVHLAFDKNRVLVASDNSDLFGYRITNSDWVKTTVATDIIFGKCLSVQLFNGDLYFRDDSTQMIRVAKGKDWRKLENTNVYSDSPFAAADVDKDGFVDLAVINKNKLSILAGPNFDRYIKEIVCKEQTEEGATIAKDCSPAFGDVDGDGNIDLLVGTSNGGIDTYLGSNFDKSEMFDWINVGNRAAPQFGDADADGVPELLVTNSDGNMVAYKKSGQNWDEWRSWTFVPSSAFEKVGQYYNSYMLDASLVEWKDDHDAVKAYASQLDDCEPKFFDEIAFVIAHTSPEILRTMARMDQSDILTRNAKTIYNYAPLLPYLKLVEKDDFTTIVYNINGKEVELPRDDYYWYVVHPKIFLELPVGIDSSWWNKSAKDYGMTIEEWWSHQENFFQGKPIFWREAFKTDKTYGSSVIDAASQANTYEQAIANIYKLKEVGESKNFTYGFLTDDLYPWEIYKKHYGSCGENSIVFASMARTALIPCYIVVNQGEDHQWNEVWMPDAWRHLEPNAGNLTWDDPGISSEGEDHKTKNISAVVGWRGDDFMFPTTTSVHNGQQGYTQKISGYTDTADVTIKVLDSENQPVESGLVIVRTGWKDSRVITIWAYTGSDGIVHFDLGHESYYLVDILTPYGMTGLSRLVVDEMKKYELTVHVPGKPAYSKPAYNKISSSSSGQVTIESINDELRPINFKTGKIVLGNGGYLFENYQYRGPLFFRQPVNASPITLKIGDNYLRANQGDCFDLENQKSFKLVNDSFYTYKTMTIKFKVPKSESVRQK